MARAAICALVDLATSMIRNGSTDWKEFHQRALEDYGLDMDEATARGIWDTGGENHAKARTSTEKKLRDARRNVAKVLEEVDHTTAREFMEAGYRAGLLSTLRPAQASLLGNVVGMASELVTRWPSTLVDLVLSKATGQRTTSTAGLSQVKGMASKEALANMWQTLKEGSSPDTATPAQEGERRINFRPVEHRTGNPSAVDIPFRAASWVINKVFDVISTADKPARVAAFNQGAVEAAHVIALNEGLSGSAADARVSELIGGKDPQSYQVMLAAAAKMADDEAGPLRNVILNAKRHEDEMILNLEFPATRATKTLASAFGPLGTLVLPFVKIPINSIARGLQHTPLGLLHGGAKAIEAIAKKASEPAASAVAQRAASTSIGRSLTGLPLIPLGYALAEMGLLSPPSPDDAGERDTAQAAGVQGSSVKLGAVWYALRDFPQLMPLMIGAVWHDMVARERAKGQDERQGARDLAISTIATGARSALDIPTLQGVRSVFETGQQLSRAAREGEDPSKYLLKNQIVSNLAGAIIPAGVTDIGAMGDENVRAGQSFGERVKSDTPFLRATQPIQHDTFGRPVHRTSGVMSQVRGVSPNVDEKSGDPVAQEAYRLRLSIPKPRRLPDEGEVAYQDRVVESGERVHSALERVMSSPRYSDATDPEKRKMLERARSSARRLASVVRR